MRSPLYGAAPVRCDLDAVGPEHLAGVDAVVHCAAYVEEWGTRDDFWKGNVEGTTRMLDVARRAGVGRFIHIGTEAALFDGHDLVDIDETFPYPTRQRYLYSETKAEAERRVLAANGDGLTTISIEGTWRALGIRKAPPMTAFAVAMMSRTVTVKTDKARAELGYAPAMSVADGLAAMPRLA